MVNLVDRSDVSGKVFGPVCITCFVALGSAEESVQGVRGGKEGPKHKDCATPAERQLSTTRGNGASARES
ncbi:MAG: hypothetical protein A2665_01925 [Candidatus Zambryskibacteria bacterium RIFCSPHIGHO2_01_FULL_46_30]|uniref:Uncharacterized protein n=1 Tax=Candidatus Zambryskibacteria bacterium RIFCSPHIGHO2_01_FULL_46_30 TaxID=1802739 RepID=A0A1G2T318_9BACT|nr:MAG: hypothetical protein A2665_01925 [Candidatus Zambryskibacteria bacterium RIFCSPHIGHO2_01_FULL_46_30]OHB06661.1 MAG: hypothetical protein A3B22_00910 [Candidatus Zambryskibacteria bacterium RIFCSPLOWO2_01_FULL_47_33]